MVLDLLVFPLVIVAVGVGIFVLFGLVTTEGKGPRDYLDLIRTGDSNRRWQAAFELSKVLQAGKDPALKEYQLFPFFCDKAERHTGERYYQGHHFIADVF